MIIHKIVSPIASNDIAWALSGRIANSRFTAEVDPGRRKVTIRKVRLLKKKLYCGNHPKACELVIHGKHKRLDFLEGADWVEFNDLVNDVLDRMDVECHVESAVCIVRKGRRRRVEYDANVQQANGNWQWDKDGPDYHYADNCGSTEENQMISTFPFGTPGIHAVKDYFCVGAHDHDH